MQALAARHRLALNRIGEAIHITTGRKAAQGFPPDADNMVVFLEADMALESMPDDVDIFWGAYLGTQDEILMSGGLKEILADIKDVRAAARADKGWIMDTYLLRKKK